MSVSSAKVKSKHDLFNPAFSDTRQQKMKLSFQPQLCTDVALEETEATVRCQHKNHQVLQNLLCAWTLLTPAQTGL